MVGVNPDVKPGVIALSHQRFIYVIGNNIVLHNVSEKVQKYIPGTEGAEGFSMFEMSPCNKFLVVCEKAQQALCTIYELHGDNVKRRRRLTAAELLATEFVSISFARTEDKLQQYVCTLTNKCTDGHYKIVVWLWDKQYKMVTYANVKLDVGVDQVPLNASFNPEDPRSIVITGKNIYRYLKMNNNF